MTRTPDPQLFKEHILHYLRAYASEDRPQKSRQLQAVWDISDVTVRQAIGLLRDDGEPIASGPTGFYYATTPDELESTINNLGERIAVMSRRRSMLIQCQNRMKEDDTGQRLLFTDLTRGG
tara:strand:- start:749 stop:1111 length:363 start_codon:yes stop_codon:yes gene_type:complete